MTVLDAIISGVREACRNGLLDWSPRLMLAMYSSEVQAARTYLHLTLTDTQRMCKARCTRCCRADTAASSPKR